MRGPRGKGFAEMAVMRVPNCGYETPLVEHSIQFPDFAAVIISSIILLVTSVRIFLFTNEIWLLVKHSGTVSNVQCRLNSEEPELLYCFLVCI